ncbi:hypothetical protein AMECASPLE_018366 [Ameca splendens]|uniref:Muniscin C-terminal domain-containing protein n=1 Tax=Ameca splendens TaxID=208324 RepID=A0ABV0YPL6_9TELE
MRSFPTGTPPPLPPKNVPTSSPTTGAPSADDTEASVDANGSSRKPSIADLDNIFGPEAAPSAGEDTDDNWVCFSEHSPAGPPAPKEPAPHIPSSPPPPKEPAPPPPASPPPPETPAPPLTTSPPPLPISLSPKEDFPPPLPTSPPPSEEPFPAPAHSGPSTPEDRNPLTVATSSSPASKEHTSPPASFTPPLSSPANVSPVPAPKEGPLELVAPSAKEPTTYSVPPPLVLYQENQSKNTNTSHPKEEGDKTVTSPKDASKGSQSTPPPPPPPPTYRAVVSSPGPTSGAGGTNSGSSSPVRPSTPSSVNPTPPPPPPRPPSRPKLPPGKPAVGDVNRPFSPPIHSASPPPIAPLARAESTSSISSTNSMSAANTPTVSKELCVSVSGCSRGPSPLTMGAQDTLPVAAAFTETVNAFFKGADPSKCVVKIIGEMVLSFPAGITRHFANNPSPAVLTFSITNYSRLEHVLPNPQLLCW